MTLPETSTPIVAAAFVGCIGLLGIFSGIVARLRVSAESKALDQGEDALSSSLLASNLDSTDPATWLASNGLAKDTHFGDHLLSVWCGWLGDRVPSLSELHSLSTRRERRRLSARMSGGITALLLVCGIAGTLLCIHPILEAFTIPVNEKAEVLIDPLVAQKLIRSLGSAFLPSLSALVFTVLVAIFRGMYLQATTGLAWRLDRFAVSQLFPMFKPKRFGAELTEVHFKLSRLVERLDERDQKFGKGVETLGKAAIDIREAGPEFKAASAKITIAANKLAAETESMTEALSSYFGEDSALGNAIKSLKETLESSKEAAAQLSKGGALLSTSLSEATNKFESSKTHLDTSVAGIPLLIQQGCDAGNKALIDSSATLNQAHSRITDAVVVIPQQIEQGCKAGSETLINANQKSSNEVVVAIAETAKAAATEIKSGISNVIDGIQSSSAKAGVVITQAVSDASQQAATKLRHASDAVAKAIKLEVEPIAEVGTEIRKGLDDTLASIESANQSIRNTTNDASIQAATVIGQAADDASKSIRAEVVPITQVAGDMRRTLNDASARLAKADKVTTGTISPTKRILKGMKRILSFAQPSHRTV